MGPNRYPFFQRHLGDLQTLEDEAQSLTSDLSNTAAGITEVNTPLLYIGLGLLGLASLVWIINSVEDSLSGYDRRRRARKRARIREKYERKLREA